MSQLVYFLENKSRGPQIAAEVLDTLQSTEKLLERAFICATGNNVILCGVNNLGSGVYSEGIIIWNNELFYFEGGTFGQYIVVNEQTTECNFCSGDRYRIFTIRTTKFANSVSPGQEYLPVTPNIPELYHLTYSLVTLNQEVININNDITDIYQEINNINTFIDNIDTYITNFITNNNNWDLTFEIGEIIGVSSAKVSQFDFTNPATAGIGKPGRYAKWAICNGNNGTMDYGGVTLRGYKYNDNAHNFTTLGGGSDFISLDIDNLPAHRHKYFDAFLNACDGGSCFSSSVDAHAIASGVNQGTITVGLGQISEGSTQDRDAVWYDRNTGDGTNNIGNQDEIPFIPDPIDITNEYRTIVLIQKIA
jgi:hypothetical protein